jgi:DNA-binding NtrC family response regulator
VKETIAAKAQTKVRAPGRDVLIIDRDEDLAQLYCRFLDENGFSADTAASKEGCLRKLRQKSWAVLVLDREHPRCEARALFHCLRKEGLLLPVILTTWVASPDVVLRLVVPPAVLCLRKFFPLPMLLDGVRFASECRVLDDRGSGSRQFPSQNETHQSGKS